MLSFSAVVRYRLHDCTWLTPLGAVIRRTPQHPLAASVRSPHTSTATQSDIRGLAISITAGQRLHARAESRGHIVAANLAQGRIGHMPADRDGCSPMCAHCSRDVDTAVIGPP
jgi:hypothetical protein